MIEKPVRSPIVPPIADNSSTNLAALSFVTLSKNGALNCILTNFKFGLWSSYSNEKRDNDKVLKYFLFNVPLYTDGKL